MNVKLTAPRTALPFVAFAPSLRSFRRPLLWALLLLFPLPGMAQILDISGGIQTYVSLTNTTVNMTGRSELHITAASNPIPGCVINLNSSDAWFFLENIQPSNVIANYLSQIQVSGAAVNSGSSGTSTTTVFARNTSTGAGVAVLGESFGTDSTAVFSNYSTGDIFRGFGSTGLVFRILNDGSFIANGTKSAVVETRSFGKRQLYTVESPENWFEDFGKARLGNGRATVKLDPVFTETVNTENDYHVFLTPKGDCTGLYVANQSASSFEVRELQGGKSAIEFDYRIVAKRKDHEQARLAVFEDPKPQTQPARLSDPSLRH